MPFTYDPALVALSIAIAILGSFTGLVMTAGIRRIRGPEVALRVALGGIGVGGGVWSMHFIAMLAVVLPIHAHLRYSPDGRLGDDRGDRHGDRFLHRQPRPVRQLYAADQRGFSRLRYRRDALSRYECA